MIATELASYYNNLIAEQTMAGNMLDMAVTTADTNQVSALITRYLSEKNYKTIMDAPNRLEQLEYTHNILRKHMLKQKIYALDMLISAEAWFQGYCRAAKAEKSNPKFADHDKAFTFDRNEQDMAASIIRLSSQEGAYLEMARKKDLNPAQLEVYIQKQMEWSMERYSKRLKDSAGFSADRDERLRDVCEGYMTLADTAQNLMLMHLSVHFMRLTLDREYKGTAYEAAVLESCEGMLESSQSTLQSPSKIYPDLVGAVAQQRINAKHGSAPAKPAML